MAMRTMGDKTWSQRKMTAATLSRQRHRQPLHAAAQSEGSSHASLNMPVHQAAHQATYKATHRRRLRRLTRSALHAVAPAPDCLKFGERATRRSLKKEPPSCTKNWSPTSAARLPTRKFSLSSRNLGSQVVI